MHFVARKKRFCRMRPKVGKRFCAEHQEEITNSCSEEYEEVKDRRIKCPLDPTQQFPVPAMSPSYLNI